MGQLKQKEKQSGGEREGGRASEIGREGDKRKEILKQSGRKVKGERRILSKQF